MRLKQTSISSLLCLLNGWNRMIYGSSWKINFTPSRDSQTYLCHMFMVHWTWKFYAVVFMVFYGNGLTKQSHFDNLNIRVKYALVKNTVKSFGCGKKLFFASTIRAIKTSPDIQFFCCCQKIIYNYILLFKYMHVPVNSVYTAFPWKAYILLYCLPCVFSLYQKVVTNAVHKALCMQNCVQITKMPLFFVRHKEFIKSVEF